MHRIQLYHRPENKGVSLDITHFKKHFLVDKYQTWIQLQFAQKKGNYMSVRRLYRSGNSWVITLSADQLQHMAIDPGGYIRVETAPRKRLRLSKAPTKLQLQHPIS